MTLKLIIMIQLGKTPLYTLILVQVGNVRGFPIAKKLYLLKLNFQFKCSIIALRVLSPNKRVSFAKRVKGGGMLSLLPKSLPPFVFPL